VYSYLLILALVIFGAICGLMYSVFTMPMAPQRPILPGSKSNGTHVFQPTVLMISLDGFRADYMDRRITPNLERLRKTGVSPEYMKPSFPTITFPNVFLL
jgi:predicted AlkP superfamily pyrophosphatase or phosphodiesterase